MTRLVEWYYSAVLRVSGLLLLGPILVVLAVLELIERLEERRWRRFD